MKNIKLLIEYDGTDFCGWQVQPNGRAVQQCIEEALFAVTGKETAVIGSGRTDAGVHARGQVANFFTESKLPPQRFAQALNAYLPESVRIKASEEAAPEFHARFSAKQKTYSYRIRNSAVASPLNGRFEYQCFGSLDTEKMKRVCALLEGTHDFAPFMAAGSSVKDTVRTVYFARLMTDELPVLVFEVCGNGFLYKMVRNMVGLLLEVGRGKLTEKDAAEVLSGKDSFTWFTAPAKGLILECVEYDRQEAAF